MKRFEFSYKSKDDTMHFVIIWDVDVVSACERVLGREVKEDELKHSRHNKFIRGWENTLFTIFEGDAPIGTSVSFVPAALYVKKDSNVEQILAGLGLE